MSTEELNVAKKAIRSILVTHKAPIPYTELDKQHHDFVGHRIPFQKFKSRSLIEFLQSMPEVVKLDKRATRFGCHEYFVQNIPDEKTKHISEMVAKQRPARRGRGGSSSRPPPGPARGSHFRSYSQPSFRQSRDRPRSPSSDRRNAERCRAPSRFGPALAANRSSDRGKPPQYTVIAPQTTREERRQEEAATPMVASQTAREVRPAEEAARPPSPSVIAPVPRTPGFVPRTFLNATSSIHASQDANQNAPAPVPENVIFSGAPGHQAETLPQPSALEVTAGHKRPSEYPLASEKKVINSFPIYGPNATYQQYRFHSLPPGYFIRPNAVLAPVIHPNVLAASGFANPIARQQMLDRMRVMDFNQNPQYRPLNPNLLISGEPLNPNFHRGPPNSALPNPIMNSSGGPSANQSALSQPEPKKIDSNRAAESYPINNRHAPTGVLIDIGPEKSSHARIDGNVPISGNVFAPSEPTVRSVFNRGSTRQNAPSRDNAASAISLIRQGDESTRSNGDNIESADMEFSSEEENAFIHPTIKDRMSTLLKEHPDGIAACDFLTKYKSRFRHDLDPNSYGYSNIIDLASNNTNIFFGNRTNSYHDFIFYSAGIDAANAALLLRQQKQKESLDMFGQIPVNIVNNVRDLVSKYGTHGIKSSDFLMAYQGMHDQIDVSEFGFDSVDDFLLALDDRAVRIVHTGQEGLRIYQITSQLETDSEIASLVAVQPIPSNQLSLLNSSLPVAAIPLGKMIRNLTIPESVKPGDTVRVVIQEVYTPNRFYLIFEGAHYSRQLENLQLEMNLFYETHKDFKPNDSFHIGLYVACAYGGDFQRARITERITHNLCKVFYIDFGTAKKVPTDQIWYLHRRFGALPAQCVLGSLHNILPLEGEEWPKETTNTFLVLCNPSHLNNVISARVHCMDRENLMLAVTLFYESKVTTGVDTKPFTIINDHLVNIGLARYSEPSQRAITYQVPFQDPCESVQRQHPPTYGGQLLRALLPGPSSRSSEQPGPSRACGDYGYRVSSEDMNRQPKYSPDYLTPPPSEIFLSDADSA